MIGGAVPNAAGSTGGNYCAKYLSGVGKTALEGKTGHDKALDNYQVAMAKYTPNRTMLLDWIETNREIKEQAKQNITDTDHAFKLYNQTHRDRQITPPKSPDSLTFIYPASSRNRVSYFLSAAARWCSAMELFAFFVELPRRQNYGCQARQSLLQPKQLLERRLFHQKISRRKFFFRCLAHRLSSTSSIAQSSFCLHIRV